MGRTRNLRGAGSNGGELSSIERFQNAAGMSSMSDYLRRLVVIYSIVALVAVAHILRLGSYLQGALYNFYYSYFSDFILPFTFYFLLCGLEQIPLLRRWEAKFAIAFLIPSIAETCQYFGIPVLGSTFDPLDYLMYGLGALSAAIFDTQVLSRKFGFWSRKKTNM